MREIRLSFQRPHRRIVNARQGANKAAAGLNLALLLL
jgi:hypothetical protein